MAISSASLLDMLRRAGLARLAVVPCSSMTGLINHAQAETHLAYANAPNEGEALAYAAGAWLGGQVSGVLCQNSGIGNLYNALTSLVAAYAIPALIVAGWRGAPDLPDEPQHRLMGAITEDLFRLAGARIVRLASPGDLAALACALREAFGERMPVAALVTRTTFDAATAEALASPPPRTHAEPRYSLCSPRYTRRRAIETIARAVPKKAAVVASTGLIAREYCVTADAPNIFYMVGSMGHAGALALGINAAADLPTVVVDGDGAVLMRPSGMAFIGTVAPKAFCHIVLDNGVHASTGGQATLSGLADLAAVAAAFGYAASFDTADPARVAQVCSEALSGNGPVFVRLRIDEGGAPPPRIAIPLPDLAARMQKACLDAQA